MTSPGLTLFAALIVVEKTFILCTALLLMPGQSMIIQDLPHSC